MVERIAQMKGGNLSSSFTTQQMMGVRGRKERVVVHIAWSRIKQPHHHQRHLQVFILGVCCERQVLVTPSPIRIFMRHL